MDASLLPQRPLVDTGIMIRALRQKIDSETPDCVELIDALVAANATLLIAAPSLTEILRKPGTAPPRVDGLVVVGFDERAAVQLANQFPNDGLVETRDSSFGPLAYYKYDAMIVACALRWGADCIISLDKGMHSLAKRIGFRVERPNAFQRESVV